jgi:acetyl-CoA carboxylase alpha subunit
MAERDDEIAGKLADLDARLAEVETLQQLILRLLSITKPLDSVLEQYGATESQERAFYRLLDDLAVRARGREAERPTFAYFVSQLGTMFPPLRGDRQFVELVIDTLKLERPAYRALHGYMAAQGWPAWASIP